MNRHHRWLTARPFSITVTILLLAASALAGATSTGVTAAGGSVRRPARSGLTALAGSPGIPVANPRTGTLYVPLQCRKGDACAGTPEHVLAVINAARCNANVTTDCAVVAKAAVGANPFAAVVDRATDTIYVASGAGGSKTGTVSVLNGARCNASVTDGCGKAMATIRISGFPAAAALNPRTDTLYVASPIGDVFVIDTSACNALTTTGCGKPVRTVKDRLAPDGVGVDVATNTVYAANGGPTGNGNTVSVIDGAMCDGTNGSGCARRPRTVKVGSNPVYDVVDQATDTVYVANYNDGTVSVIDGARCNAKVAAGCRRRFPAVPTGSGTAFVAVDDSRHTVFAINQFDDTLSAINTRTCDGAVTSGCTKRPPDEQATFSPPRGSNPSAFALVPQTGTAYLVNAGGENFFAPVSISRCNAVRTAGCRAELPSVPDAEYWAAADPATDTIYAGNDSKPQIDVLNGATCHAGDPSGCAPVAEIPMKDPHANVGAIDDTTHTLYASDPFSDTISVINTTKCNASDTTGCASAAPRITIGTSPGPPVLDTATGTLYAPFGPRSNLVAVVNAATCNAEVTSGCGQTPSRVAVGNGTFLIGLSAATDTIYAPSKGFSSPTGDTVAVINGATCNAGDHAGCRHPAATVKVGVGPLGVAVDDLTHTVYVANSGGGDLPGTLSVINGATCNGADTSGCARPKPTVSVGLTPSVLAADASTDTLYVTDDSSAAISILNGSKCNAMVTSGCGTPVPEQPVNSMPFDLALNQATNTVYLTLVGSRSMSVLGSP